jgi:hypothetical protein
MLDGDQIANGREQVDVGHYGIANLTAGEAQTRMISETPMP